MTPVGLQRVWSYAMIRKIRWNSDCVQAEKKKKTTLHEERAGCCCQGRKERKGLLLPTRPQNRTPAAT